MRNLQIGVIGSMADLNYSQEILNKAKQLGEVIAESGNTLVFGAEKDAQSLPTEAAKACVERGGFTIGITYEKGLDIFEPNSASVVIATGLVRGGGREMVQSLSCDGIIAISGGSGTLNELTVAYQANIPVVLLANTGGWVSRLENTYLDARNRYQYITANDPKSALKLLLKYIGSR